MGMELGGRRCVWTGRIWALPSRRSGRVLLSHEAEDLEDAGRESGAEHRPGRGRPAACISRLRRPGGNAASGVRAMWEDRQPAAYGLDGRDPFVPETRWTSELGYTEPMWRRDAAP